MTVKAGVVLFAHGSRDPDWATPFRAIERKVTEAKQDALVSLAFLELMQPSLPDAVARLAASGCERITIAPLFMAQGAHLKRDLGKLLADLEERYPQLELVVLPAAGEVDSVTAAIGDWIVSRVQPQ